MIPMRPPETSPGKMLAEQLARGGSVTQEMHAHRLGISRVRLNEILNDRRGISADTALRLARYLETPAEQWMELSARWELDGARRRRALMRRVDAIVPLHRRQRGLEALLPSEDREPGGASEEMRELSRETERLRALVTAQARALEEADRLREFLRRRGLLAQAERFTRIQADLEEISPESQTRAAG